MKYLNRRSDGSYRYLRAYPSKLKRNLDGLPANFTYELNDISDASTDAAKHTAIAKASKAFDLKIKMLTASDPSSFSETEMALAVEQILKQSQVQAGQLANPPDDVDPHDTEWDAELYVAGADDAYTNYRYGTATFEDEAKLRAVQALVKMPEIKREKTFRQAWADYLSDMLITDVTTGLGKDKQGRFNRVIAITGDFMISDETKDDVLDRLQLYINEKVSQGLKAQTIKRSLKEVFAAIRSVPRLAWADSVTLNANKKSLRIPKETPEVRGRVFTKDELTRLISKCLSEPDAMWTCLLIQLHAGLGPREISRLRLDKDVHLDAPVPHILFRGGDDLTTKTSARVRVVPIVLGLDVVRKWLPRTHEWLHSIGIDSPTVSLNKRLRSLFEVSAEDAPYVKTHSLRHTWLRLVKRAGIDARREHAIGGWSKKNDGEINQLTEIVYDPNGFRDDPELLKQLEDAQRAIFSPWLPSDAPDSNVIQIRR